MFSLKFKCVFMSKRDICTVHKQRVGFNLYTAQVDKSKMWILIGMKISNLRRKY